MKDIPGINGEVFNVVYDDGCKKGVILYTQEGVVILLDRLYEEIRHGDEEHQKWLKDKIEEFKKSL